jgi:hypothetical protein
VSWAAVIAGAFVVAALSLALLALGTGIGFSAVSPWANAGASASAIGWTGIGWLVLQLIASSAGGYLAGRLRTKRFLTRQRGVIVADLAVAVRFGCRILTDAVEMLGVLQARTTTDCHSTSLFDSSRG